ncbi:phytanoyl-CoA dioxygenase family protein [Billgrantia kenyensis]|uniref:Phytanoyl-CoA dioxygenase n=1 Tax=Billgrantia kenyensis TaxID=321266 RepID=A0A7V9W515_9GAMM|nr:phytanoyl-CoA dioxygenase family protein [Halomonas kenyensis]MBA2781156.1 phytanoyl-CoA dioxygenase family protein [Halomonas kenyensis]MCG6663848.1 phytanoyl-CoA dioxygenase [Halomonas kenyensis]
MLGSVSLKQFEEVMADKGWFVFEKALDSDFIACLRADCFKWIEICRKYQIRNGINENGDGTAHHCLGSGDSIDAYIDMHLFHDYISRFFNGEPYICNSLTPIGGYPGADIYVHKLHRDVRTMIPGYPLKLNMLVMCDDFTADNGTMMLSGSQYRPDCPSDEEFERNHERLIAPAGSVVLFHSTLWHKGAHIEGPHNRVALTVGYGRAYVKPHMDYARMLGEKYGECLSPLTRQVLGYNSRVPVNLDEWYRPVEKRLYHANQG